MAHFRCSLRILIPTTTHLHQIYDGHVSASSRCLIVELGTAACRNRAATASKLAVCCSYTAACMRC